MFWAGALAEMGGRDPREVELALHELARKELVRPARTSSMAGRGRVRLLAPAGQGRLLRPDPARRPRRPPPRGRRLDRATRRASGPRTWPTCSPTTTCSALELARAAGQAEQAQELEANAIRYLALAGERALALDVERAEASLAKALALAPAGHPERASLLERWAQAAQQQGRLQEATSRARGGARPLPRAGRRASPPGGC